MLFDDAHARNPRAQPGQFVQMRAQQSLHLLRRPMSVHDEGEGWRTFMVKPVGPASRELVSVRRGGTLDVSPPLGRGFPDVSQLEMNPLLLVGGGFGIAPLHFLARRLDASPGLPGYTIVYGGRTRGDVELDVLENVRGRILPSTEDGSAGYRGTCVALAREWLEERGSAARETVVLTCGSNAMMSALHTALHGRVRRIYAALEEIMGCGVGVCMGCVVRTSRGHVPICTEGPVFPSEHVFGLEEEVAHV